MYTADKDLKPQSPQPPQNSQLIAIARLIEDQPELLKPFLSRLLESELFFFCRPGSTPNSASMVGMRIGAGSSDEHFVYPIFMSAELADRNISSYIVDGKQTFTDKLSAYPLLNIIAKDDSCTGIGLVYEDPDNSLFINSSLLKEALGYPTSQSPTAIKLNNLLYPELKDDLLEKFQQILPYFKDITEATLLINQGPTERGLLLIFMTFANFNDQNLLIDCIRRLIPASGIVCTNIEVARFSPKQRKTYENLSNRGLKLK